MGVGGMLMIGLLLLQAEFDATGDCKPLPLRMSD